MTTKTQDSIRTEAVLGNWTRQTLTANKGEVRRDYFARRNDLVQVFYDHRGRITQAQLHRLKRGASIGTIVEELGPKDADKSARIVGWLQPR